MFLQITHFICSSLWNNSTLYPNPIHSFRCSRDVILQWSMGDGFHCSQFALCCFRPEYLLDSWHIHAKHAFTRYWSDFLIIVRILLPNLLPLNQSIGSVLLFFFCSRWVSAGIHTGIALVDLSSGVADAIQCFIHTNSQIYRVKKAFHSQQFDARICHTHFGSTSI